MGASHSTKNSGLNFRNNYFRVLNSTVCSTRPDRFVPFPFGHISRRDLLDKIKDHDEVTEVNVSSAVSCFMRRNSSSSTLKLKKKIVSARGFSAALNFRKL